MHTKSNILWMNNTVLHIVKFSQATKTEYLLIQVASSVERPAADGEEAVKVNGHAEVAVKPAEEPSKDNVLEQEDAPLQTPLQQM